MVAMEADRMEKEQQRTTRKRPRSAWDVVPSEQEVGWIWVLCFGIRFSRDDDVLNYGAHGN